MDLSIIIVNWNTRGLLAQCLASVYANPPDCTFDIWVVDNASSDGSVETVQQQFPHVHLISNTENVGFARANNQATRASTGRYILLLNSDTIVQASALTMMVSFLNKDICAAIVGARIVNSDATPQPCFGSFPNLFSETASAWGLDTHWPLSVLLRPQLSPEDGARQADWVLGAALMARRQALDEVGLLDESFFMFSEEVDLAYRLAKAGWRTYVLGAARVMHLGGQSTRQANASMKAELFRSKMKYFSKHRGGPAATALRLIFEFSIQGRRLNYRMRGQEREYRVWSEAWKCFRAPARYPPVTPQGALPVEST